MTANDGRFIFIAAVKVLKRAINGRCNLTRHSNFGDEAHRIGPSDINVDEGQLMKPIDVSNRRCSPV